MSRKADDVTLDSFRNEITLSGPSSSIDSEGIEAEGINSGRIGAEGVTRIENEETGDTSQKKDVSTSSKGLKLRACKRLVWRTSKLDENTRKMYEHILEARKKIDNLKARNLRYCTMHSLKHFEFKTKYTKHFGE